MEKERKITKQNIIDFLDYKKLEGNLSHDGLDKIIGLTEEMVIGYMDSPSSQMRQATIDRVLNAFEMNSQEFFEYIDKNRFQSWRGSHREYSDKTRLFLRLRNKFIGETQQSIGDRLGVTNVMVHHFINGRSDLFMKQTIARIQNAYKVSAAELCTNMSDYEALATQNITPEERETIKSRIFKPC